MIVPGRYIINTGTGAAFDFFVLGTVDEYASLLEGSTILITSINVIGYNTQVIFKVVISDNPFKGKAIAERGSFGYVDFRNPARNVLPEQELSIFTPVS